MHLHRYGVTGRYGMGHLGEQSLQPFQESPTPIVGKKENFALLACVHDVDLANSIAQQSS